MSDSVVVEGPPEEAQQDVPPVDPEIDALLAFEPVPRKREVEGAWTPELQREFIQRLALHGSPGRAAEEMGKTETGVRKLYRSPEGASFRASWDGAIALAKRRREERAAKEYVAPGSKAPSIDHRFKLVPAGGAGAGAAGRLEEDAEMYRQMAEMKDRITSKLWMARRLFLFMIAPYPGKRAAYEILTEFPIDWDKAREMEEQPDEPFRVPNMRRPDMILTAEDGWLGDLVHGPDQLAELRQMMNEFLIEEGREPVDWDAEEG